MCIRDRNNNVLTLSIVFVLTFLGISSFNKFPQDSMPPFTVRFANVITTFPGASPERVEMLVTDKIEKQLQQIAELKDIDSESRTGISIISIRIKDEYSDMQPIYDNIRRKVEDIEHELPSGCFVQIKDEDLVDVYGIIYTITADGYTYAETLDIAEDVRDGLIKLPNASKVEIVGEQEELIYIDYDNARFADLGLTQEKLKAILSKTNIIFPGGDMKIGNERIIFEPSGNYESIEDLKNTIVSDKDKDIILLGDIARVYRGYRKPKESIVRINGVPGISLGVALKKGGNIVELGKEIDELFAYYKSVYPHGVEFTRSASQDLFVEKSVNDFVNNLLQSVVVVLVVMLLFLGLRTGVVVASLVPVVMVTTFLMMSLLGVGLNQISLAALIMALGMLVDNAIVMAESIMVKMDKGEKALDSAIESASELKVPLLISSLTTSAAFMPFYLAQSMMGEIVGEIFLVISIALISSWVFALTLIPLLSIIFIKVKKNGESEDGKQTFIERLNERYRKILIANLKSPSRLIIVIVVLFFFSIWILRFIPSVFMPDSERFLVTANFEMPIGTDIDRTDKVIHSVEVFLNKNFMVKDAESEGVVNYTSYIGEGAPKYDLGYTAPEKTSYTAHILINTTSNEFNQVVIDKLDAFCFENFPDLLPTIKRLGTTGGNTNPVSVRISGKDPDNLMKIMESVKQKMVQTSGSKNITDDWGMRTKKIVVDIDQTRGQYAGISNQDVALSLETVLTGKDIGIYREEDKSIPIVMIEKSSEGLCVEKLEGLNIYSQQTGVNAPLSQVADLNVHWQFSKIKRRNLFKTIAVSCDFQTGYTANSIILELEPWLQENQPGWGPGYTYEWGGEAENRAEGMQSVIDFLPLAFFLILILLIGQFNSIKKPLIVLLTIPLGIIGVVFGLIIARSYFGFFAFLGLISLAGIVINNAIVLLDRIEMEINENMKTPQEAIIAAANERFRPILLTTATTICGLLPLWIGGGIMFEPLAVGILFGLMFATVVTLLFVPTMYKILFRVSYDDYQFM